MPTIQMQQTFTAPPERVFALVTDHAKLGKYLDANITVERQGTPAPNGLGAVRLVKARGTSVREEVVAWDAPRAMDYKVISGAPLRDHLGQLRFAPEGSGTRLDYSIRFDLPWWLGGSLAAGFVARMLETQITAGLRKIAADLR